jgi:hypothetical protein
MRFSKTRNRSPMLRTIAIALGMAVMTASMAVTPARADSDDWRHGRDGDTLRRDRDRESHERDWREHRAGIYYNPGYIYAPPPVIYAPPPPPAGLNIIVPLDIH